ncbi:hypothetical protein BJ742DRAFT_867682 [Cladochytrium replicatum]|nr:hypothetical protein BJ742DRAFT_867682 [Cladochytrium replicatum]
MSVPTLEWLPEDVLDALVRWVDDAASWRLAQGCRRLRTILLPAALSHRPVILHSRDKDSLEAFCHAFEDRHDLLEMFSEIQVTKGDPEPFAFRNNPNYATMFRILSTFCLHNRLKSLSLTLKQASSHDQLDEKLVIHFFGVVREQVRLQHLTFNALYLRRGMLSYPTIKSVSEALAKVRDTITRFEWRVDCSNSVDHAKVVLLRSCPELRELRLYTPTSNPELLDESPTAISQNERGNLWELEIGFIKSNFQPQLLARWSKTISTSSIFRNLHALTLHVSSPRCDELASMLRGCFQLRRLCIDLHTTAFYEPYKAGSPSFEAVARAISEHPNVSYFKFSLLWLGLHFEQRMVEDLAWAIAKSVSITCIDVSVGNSSCAFAFLKRLAEEVCPKLGEIVFSVFFDSISQACERDWQEELSPTLASAHALKTFTLHVHARKSSKQDMAVLRDKLAHVRDGRANSQVQLTFSVLVSLMSGPDVKSVIGKLFSASMPEITATTRRSQPAFIDLPVELVSNIAALIATEEHGSGCPLEHQHTDIFGSENGSSCRVGACQRRSQRPIRSDRQRRAILPFSQTCRRVHEALLPLIYRRVHFFDEEKGAQDDISTSSEGWETKQRRKVEVVCALMTERPELTTHVHTVDIDAAVWSSLPAFIHNLLSSLLVRVERANIRLSNSKHFKSLSVAIACLVENSRLRTLAISDLVAMEVGVSGLLGAILARRQVEDLRIGIAGYERCAIPSRPAIALSYATERLKSVSIRFSSRRNDAMFLRASGMILRELRYLPVTHVEFSCVREMGSMISKWLQHSFTLQKLKTLIFEHMDLDRVLTSLSTAMMNEESGFSPREIVLDDVQATDASWESLGQAIRSSKALQKFSLSRCLYFDPRIFLVEMLAGNKSLISLSLDGSPPLKSIHELEALLVSLRSLKTLCVEKTSLDDKHVCAVLERLKLRSPDLRTVIFEGWL